MFMKLVFKPILQQHDKTAFEIVCYSCSPLQDAVTEEFRAVAGRFLGRMLFE